MTDFPLFLQSDSDAAWCGDMCEYAKFIARLRGFFDSRDFVEMFTPLMRAESGTEPTLTPFHTTLRSFDGATSERYLITSPELALKEALSRGIGDCYQISSCFRNDEVTSPLHSPEFMMLEWYRCDASYEEIMTDVSQLFVSFGLSACTSMTMEEAFARFSEVDLWELRAEHGGDGPYTPEQDAAFEGEFFRIFLTHIEPKLGVDGVPVIVRDYPACMAALSVVKDDDPRVAERFEVYLDGVELANGFTELTDPVEQRARMEKELAQRTCSCGVSVGCDSSGCGSSGCGPADCSALPMPEQFLAALESGMPRSGGVALGVDRLFMVMRGDDALSAR